jgi:hypothetical protein
MNGGEMDSLSIGEGRMLYFHRVLLDQAEETPDLMERARERLAAVPEGQGWADLLAGPFEAMRAAVLEDSPRGGVLRAQSPLMAVLTQSERNILWQRVGLQQMVAYGQAAAADLGLTDAEQAALFGDHSASWRGKAPQSMAESGLAALKQIISIQRSLCVLYPEVEMRRDWLRAFAAELGAAPLQFLVNGGAEIVQHALAEKVRPLVDRADLPSH